MSTFTNPSVAPSPTGDHAFAPELQDSVTVRNLLTSSAEAALPPLNRDLGLQISAAAYRRLQAFFRDTARRDPTVGELRLLDALDRHGKQAPARIAVEVLTTKSPFLAETWADMMRTHGENHGIGDSFQGKKGSHAPPCTMIDALALRRSRTAGRPAILSAPWQEAIAATQGYTPVARFLVGEETRSLWVREGAPRYVSPLRTGDLILYLPRVELSKILSFLKAESALTPPFSGHLCAVARQSLLLTLTELCPAVDLYADRLITHTAQPGSIAADALCSLPRVGDDGVCDYLLRSPLQQVKVITDALKKFGITATVCGRVRAGGNTVILTRDPHGNRDIPVVSLPAALLSAMSPVYLYPMEISLKQGSDTPCAPRLARLPSALPGEGGVTPDYHEAVALTVHEGQILPFPDAMLLTATLSATIRQPDTAFTQAADTVVAATDRLRSADIHPKNMVLTVSLTASSSHVLKDGTALAAIMGIYRVATERDLPVENPNIAVAPTEGLLRVTVTAYAVDENELSQRLDCPADRQWRASGEALHKESPGFLLPVIRRPYEGCLNALSAALSRDTAARCIIRPLIMDEHKAEILDGSEIPRKETTYTLNPDSVRELCEQMHRWLTPIFCMSEEDTRTLLSEPSVTMALTDLIDMGYPIIVLGQSCKPFAEHGFLPTVLTTVRVIPTKDSAATVTYSFPADPSTRPLRGDLLSVRETTGDKTLLTIRLSDGTVIHDGFTGKGGKVLGILNGVDTTVLPILRKHNFDI